MLVKYIEVIRTYQAINEINSNVWHYQLKSLIKEYYIGIQ